MFNLFTKQSKQPASHKHNHIFSIFTGKYFKLCRSTYKNGFDEVRIYKRAKCDCGMIRDFFVSSNTFLPSMYCNDSDEKEFIKEIKSKGIMQEYEINLRDNISQPKFILKEDDK